jgi:hypothetical protein
MKSTKILGLVIALVLIGRGDLARAESPPPTTCNEVLADCESSRAKWKEAYQAENEIRRLTEVQRDEAIAAKEYAERRTTGLFEVGACILAGAGIGYLGGNTLLGMGAAGVGCALALPF